MLQSGDKPHEQYDNDDYDYDYDYDYEYDDHDDDNDDEDHESHDDNGYGNDKDDKDNNFYTGGQFLIYHMQPSSKPRQLITGPQIFTTLVDHYFHSHR